MYQPRSSRLAKSSKAHMVGLPKEIRRLSEMLIGVITDRILKLEGEVEKDIRLLNGERKPLVTHL